MSEVFYLINRPFTDVFNSIADIQKRLAPDSLYSLFLFDRTSERVHSRIKINESRIEEQKNSTDKTCLYDSIVRTVNYGLKFRSLIKSIPPICIIVSNEDNSSRISPRLVSLQIHMARGCGWKFILLTTSRTEFYKAKILGINVRILYSELNQTLIDRVTEILSQPIEDVDIDLRDINRDMEDIKIN